jgi:hypothetical protein
MPPLGRVRDRRCSDALSRVTRRMRAVPADYEIDVAAGTVFSRAWGVLTDGDLLAHQRRLRKDPAFQPSMRQLFDFREVTEVQVTGDGVRTLASANKFGKGARRAFVVKPGADAMFGLLRMFQILTTMDQDELRVQFDAIDSARNWLGLGDGDRNGKGVGASS